MAVRLPVYKMHHNSRVFHMYYTFVKNKFALMGHSGALVDIHTHLLVWLSGSLLSDEALTVPLPGRECLPRAD